MGLFDAITDLFEPRRDDREELKNAIVEALKQGNYNTVNINTLQESNRTATMENEYSSSNTTTSEKTLSPSQVPFDVSVKNSLSCPHCGVANRVDSLYCCRCGKSMISTNKQCPSCRKIYEKDCAFCKYCGTKLVEC